ncbi:FecR family protein [Persicitalea jodogahamensis]|uniref:FecR family protein n=1 Tax=Persicitalea jodogahamensis TaxID=402147 RepID=A0A8J3D327_9BACT|nr:FecR family protein [Persicitalea jodogahamensis]GHB64715.1 hypothetical protein GCM10007390_18370 [Persicitalea jodogahamensis]
MKIYFDYKVQDYLADESFRRWVLDGGLRNQDSAWSRWLLQNPDYAGEALKARDILLAARPVEEPFEEGYFETIRRETLGAIQANRRNVRPLWWQAAAAVLVVSGLLGWLLLDKTQSPETVVVAQRDDVVAPPDTSAANTVFLQKNSSDVILPVALPDGSSVLLHPGSELSYRHTTGGTREVQLTGKAFFEVTKNPSSPFLVYSGEMVTRVLGTSFTVTAYANDADFSVVVKTGQVAVSAPKEKMETAAADLDDQTTIHLVPNEQLFFNRKKSYFKRKEINQRDMLRYVPDTRNVYAFEDKPVADVFRQIGMAYGLDIDMEESLFSGCELTTNLTDEPLFEKLSILCSAVGPSTSFVVKEGRIRVISKGCNQ